MVCALSYRSENFPWLATSNGQTLPIDWVAASFSGVPGQYSLIEEIEADVWLSDRDAMRVLALSEQVLAQRDGFGMILLQAEIDEED